MTIEQKLVSKIDKNLIVLKLVEECAELSEVLVKYLTKAEHLKPSVDKITEEMGDVLFRMRVMNELLGNKEETKQREEEKARQIEEWFDTKFDKINN